MKQLVGGSGYVRHYVERIGEDGERVATWSARRLARIVDPEDYVATSPPGSPPPGWADVGRPGERRRSCRPRFRGAARNP
jgi:hypothetical protein